VGAGAFHPDNGLLKIINKINKLRKFTDEPTDFANRLVAHHAALMSQ
jgi:hypothetical protein